MTRPTRIPSDVNRPDRILGPFTARQVAILAVTAAMLYLAWTALRGVVALPVFLFAALPVGAFAFVIAVGHRDGLPLDRHLFAAVRHRIRPRHRPRPARDAVPAWLTPANADTDRPEHPGRRPTTFPARTVTDTGPPGDPGVAVVDLGPDGLVAIAELSTVNLALRTPAEQDGLVDGFARYLHALAGPTQILVHALPLDLSDHLHDLHSRARQLPHPALAAAADAHRAHLARLATAGGEHELLTRQVLLVLREPAGRGGAEHRLLRRLNDATRLLAPLDVTVTPLSAAETTVLLTRICNPDHEPRRSGQPDVVRRHPPTGHDRASQEADDGRDEPNRADPDHGPDTEEDDGWGPDPWTTNPDPRTARRTR
ncbi:PrgI family protein [Pseudonocardia sp.]|uniref:PrgI family protein n=1 Tax=Pseudonocardia sp. TaxID=60912 RepID=UPI003D12FCAB